MQLAGAGIVFMHEHVQLALDRVKQKHFFEDFYILACENQSKASPADR